ncbi:cleavage stimulating factor 64-like isoform X2 [Macadamia integrifolia]|uniref:cleavage stimulating factor 64-like isoform X2 n=1 Tax=Macadamia integrifolia TaxID=60698 RepID=UPI001C4FAEB5|nr:cleavage stimulating factor 64-like isoform X2 [Macadamia integrifolia]
MAEAFTSNLAGMSKNQLYDIMSQMKTLIEQNQQQARQILVENPLLTKALFQAQIMLGMVQPPQVMPDIQQALSQHPQQMARPGQQLNLQAAQSLPMPFGQQDQSSASQAQIQSRKPHPNQPVMPISSGSVPPVTLQSQSMPSHALPTVQQAKGHPNAPLTSMPHSVSSQLHNVPLPNVSNQPQQSLQTSGVPLMHLQPPLQPPLLQKPRPPSMPPYPHQQHLNMGANLGYQHSSSSQPHFSQSIYHSGARPPVSIGPSFPLGQPPPQSLYQAGGSHLATDFGNQAGGSMQMERGASWMTGPPDNATAVQLAGPPSLAPGQMGPGGQPGGQLPRTPQEMEKTLLQQVMSLTPEQINLLPPEQRHQVLQLQQMLR